VNLKQNCTNYSPGVKIGPTPGVIDFHFVHIVKKQKTSCLKVQGLELWYLVYEIITGSSIKVVLIMHLMLKLLN
jgi:hypothetical protein